MKIKFISAFFVVFSSLIGQFTVAQSSGGNFEDKQITSSLAMYRVSWQNDSTNSNSLVSGVYYLALNNSLSYFISARDYYTDTLTAMGMIDLGDIKKYLSPEIFSQMPKAMYPRVWVQKQSNKVITTHGFSGGKLTYEETRSLMKWRISDEYKSISGYKCQKATTRFAGRDYVAWFTAEIPYQDGPYKFCGLPGFIVLVRDVQGHYTFELQDFRKEKRPIFTQKYNNLTTKQAYFEKEKDFFHNYVLRSQSSGMGFNADSEELRRKNEAARKRYNPIERIVE